MEKTILQWLNEIEEPEIREAAIKQMRYAHHPVETLSKAIDRAFSWHNSNEGFDYWSKYYNKLIQQGK